MSLCQFGSFSLAYTSCTGCCFSPVSLFVTPWTVAHQAPLSMGFSRQDYWSGLPCPFPWDLPSSGIRPTSLTSPALADSFFTTSATREAYAYHTYPHTTDSSLLHSDLIPVFPYDPSYEPLKSVSYFWNCTHLRVSQLQTRFHVKEHLMLSFIYEKEHSSHTKGPEIVSCAKKEKHSSVGSASLVIFRC